MEQGMAEMAAAGLCFWFAIGLALAILLGQWLRKLP